jgi:hypothetical protein
MKDIGILVNEIADVLSIIPDDINLSQTCNGWLADTNTLAGHSLQGESDDPIKAMQILLDKSKQTQQLQMKLLC